jgi:hypothetical protein
MEYEASADVDFQLAESFNELQVSEKPVAEELKGFYNLMPSEAMKEFFLRNLPYTPEKYDNYSQVEPEIFYMVIPNSLKRYEEYCDDVIESGGRDILAIHIMGEQMKRQYLNHWKAIETIRVRYLQRMLALYKKWFQI